MKLTRLLLPLASLCIALGFSSCASVSAQRTPTADLAKIKHIHVVHLAADSRGIDRVLADQLNLLGYQATAGEASAAPAEVDALLTYQDKWMWDITMYMIELNVQLRARDTQMVLASAKCYRPSLQRKSPDGMAKEVLQSLLK